MKVGAFPRMLHDNILVRLEKPERLSASKRLHIPEGAKRQAHELYEAVVLAVGPGVRKKDGTRRPVDVSVGSRVLCYWPAFEFPALPEYGDNCRCIREGLIQAILS